jgi:hypothetical protein
VKTLGDPKTKESIVRRLGDLRADSPRQWGRMDPQQAVCHLSDSFISMIGERPISALRNRAAMKWAALYLPFPWPHGFKTRPEVDQLIGGTKPKEFAADKALLAVLIERIVSPVPDFTWQPHPIFGPLTNWQWMRWSYLHCDHHLRQFKA